MADQYRAPDKSGMFSASILQATAQARAAGQEAYKRGQDYFVGEQAMNIAKDSKEQHKELLEQNKSSLDDYVSAIDKLSDNIDKVYNAYNKDNGKGDDKKKTELTARIAAARASRNKLLIEAKQAESYQDNIIKAGNLFKGKDLSELITRELPFRDPLTIGKTYMNYPKLFWDTAGIKKQDYYMELNKELTPSEFIELYGRSGWKGFTQASQAEQFNWLGDKAKGIYDTIGTFFNKAPDALYELIKGED